MDNDIVTFVFISDGPKVTDIPGFTKPQCIRPAATMPTAVE